MGTTRNQIIYFLEQFKHKVRTSGIFYLEDNLKIAKTLLINEIPINVRHESLLQLNTDDYKIGPVPDYNFNSLLFWGFSKLIRNNEFNIKISLGQPRTRALCSSFQLADYSMISPAQQTPNSNEKSNNKSTTETLYQKRETSLSKRSI